jgi:hypothetical protein
MPTARHRLVSNESWKDASALAAHRDRVYVVHGETLYEVDPSAQSYRKASEEAWSTRFMVSDGNALYTIEGDGGLYRVRAEDASYERINADDWSSTRMVAVLDGKLWVADDRDVFYTVDLASGAWTEPGKASHDGGLAYDAKGISLLTGLDGMLYGWGGEGAEAGTSGISALLWRRSSAGGIHSGDFPDARALVACCGRLYLNHGGHFYEFPIPDPSKGEYLSSWQALAIDHPGRWDTVLASAARQTIYVLDATGGLFAITPDA